MQIHFINIICLTGLKIGAAPGTGSLTEVPHVHVFALDLHTLSGSRYACAAEHCTLPDNGTRSVRVEVSIVNMSICCTVVQSFTLSLCCMLLQPVFTNKLLMRGHYQTLPLAVYGWAMPANSAIKVLSQLTLPSCLHHMSAHLLCCSINMQNHMSVAAAFVGPLSTLVCGNVQDPTELTEAARNQLAAVVQADAASTSPISILPPPLPFTPPFLSLPANATQALQGLLPRWASVRTFEQAMRFQTLDKAQLQAILTAAENICQAAARRTPLMRTETQHHAAETSLATAADIKEEPEVDLVGNSTLAGISDGMFMDLDERLDSLPAGEPHADPDQKDEAVNEAAIGECAAYMAAEWCGVLGGAYASSAAADFGLAGLAAAVIVASCPR